MAEYRDTNQFVMRSGALEGTIENQVVLNPPNFKEAIRNGEDFYIQFSLMSPLVEEHLIKVLHRELENL
ncbi:MAG: hypothetical protein AB2L13_17950 [Spirochaetota bacterium]